MALISAYHAEIIAIILRTVKRNLRWACGVTDFARAYAALDRRSRRTAHTKRAITPARHSSGAAIASIETVAAPAVSTVLTTGLPNPPVSAALFARTTAVAPFVRAAIPPPATTAIGHRTSGGMSTITEALARTPAITASGAAMTSRRWSSPGM